MAKERERERGRAAGGEAQEQDETGRQDKKTKQGRPKRRVMLVVDACLVYQVARSASTCSVAWRWRRRLFESGWWMYVRANQSSTKRCAMRSDATRYDINPCGP